MASVFNKILDLVASGLSATVGPLLAPWRASREGQARIIAAKADATVMEIQTMAERMVRERAAPDGATSQAEQDLSRLAG